MSAALSVLVWSTIQNNFGDLKAFHAIVIVSAITAFLSLFVLSPFMCSLREMILIAIAFPFGFLLIMGGGVVVAVLSFLFFLYAILVMRYQIQNHVTISFYPFITYGVPAAITGLAILFAFMGYSYPLQINGSLKIPEGIIRPLIPVAETFIATQTPSYEKGMTVDEFLSVNIIKTLQEKYGSAALSDARVRSAVDEEIQKQRDDFSAQLGIELQGKETIGDVMIMLADTYANSYLVSYKEFVPLVVAISVFLAIKSAGFFINRIAVLIAWVLMRILLATKVLAKKKESIERETLFA